MLGTNQHDPLLTVEELAEYLRCSTASVYRWVREGRLASKRLGHRHLFRATDIEKLFGYAPDPGKLASKGSSQLSEEYEQ